MSCDVLIFSQDNCYYLENGARQRSNYQTATIAVTLNDLEGHSLVAGLFKCNPSNICAAFYTISADSVLAVPLH